MYCADKVLEKVLFAPLGMSGRARKRAIQNAISTIYGELEIPPEKLNLEEIRVHNSGLVDKPFKIN